MITQVTAFKDTSIKMTSYAANLFQMLYEVSVWAMLIMMAAQVSYWFMRTLMELVKALYYTSIKWGNGWKKLVYWKKMTLTKHRKKKQGHWRRWRNRGHMYWIRYKYSVAVYHLWSKHGPSVDPVRQEQGHQDTKEDKGYVESALRLFTYGIPCALWHTVSCWINRQWKEWEVPDDNFFMENKYCAPHILFNKTRTPDTSCSLN